MRYTIVQLYQSVPLTCIQPVQLPCNQYVSKLNMYQQNTTCMRLVVLQHAYVHTLYVMNTVYVRNQTIMQLTYAF